MGKVLATIAALLVIWVMYPHVKRGEFITPSPVAPGTWMGDYVSANNQDFLATPPEGYGWFRFDVWNNPPTTSRPVYRDDFQLKW